MISGASSMLAALGEHGVAVCFANPGTTELDVLRAAEGCANLRFVLGLQENVCTGAADGYGRMKGQPAATLLHLGPGFANGIANLHNARRARTPIVNIVGDQMSWHLPFDAPLTSDIGSLARPVSGWVRRVESADDAAPAAREAVEQSRISGGQVATLIFPSDFQAQYVSTSSAAPLIQCKEVGEATPWDADAAVVRLTKAKRPLFLLGGGGDLSGLGERGQKAAARLSVILGGSAYAETFPSRAERGRGLPAFDRLPYFPEPARAVLDAADLVVLVGTLPPITYFGYEGQAPKLVPDERLFALCKHGENAAERLETLADLLGAPAYEDVNQPIDEVEPGPLTPLRIGMTVARLLPESAIVSIEGGTCGYPFYAASAHAARHTALTNTGGAIGQGLPVALGAAVACAGRSVLALVSDGSTQYTIQTLWSIAHEKLPIVILVAANHEYAILRNELRRGNTPLGRDAESLTALDQPKIDWVALATAYGVPATRANNVDELAASLRVAFASKAPALIEMAL